VFPGLLFCLLGQCLLVFIVCDSEVNICLLFCVLGSDYKFGIVCIGAVITDM